MREPDEAFEPMSPSVAMLEGITPEAEHALGGLSAMHLSYFPVTVGRERRLSVADQVLPEAEARRLGVAPRLNDVYLRELHSSTTLHISGAHFAIEHVDGRFFLVDRGSACGTIVAGTRVRGRRTGGRTELRDGDEVVVGTGRSRYVFRFLISTE